MALVLWLIWLAPLIIVILAIFRVFGRRAQWIMIDFVVFSVAWICSLALSKTYPPLSFMSEYSVKDFQAYIYVMSILVIFLFFMSVLSFKFFGGSFGKRIAEYKTVNFDGSSLSWRTVIYRSLILFAFGLLILAPGPTLGYIFGKGSEGASSLVLILALLIWTWIVILSKFEDNPDDKGVMGTTALERFLKIKTVDLKKQKEI